jgi:uncharacterized protein (DUF4213/DUF364 family)
MTIELATPAEHEATLEETVGIALIAAVSKIFEARIESLELVTQAQHEKIAQLEEELNDLARHLDDKVERQLEHYMDNVSVELNYRR